MNETAATARARSSSRGNGKAKSSAGWAGNSTRRKWPGLKPGSTKPRWPARRLRRGKPVHLFRHFEIKLRQAAGVVRAERHVDAVIDIEPFRVVIHFLRQQRDAAHERPGLAEALELKGL